MTTRETSLLAAVGAYNLHRLPQSPPDARSYFDTRAELARCVSRVSPQVGKVLSGLARGHGRTPAFGRLLEGLAL